MKSTPEQESSPTPSEVLETVIEWLRGFHLDRERSKAADWLMCGLTAAGLIAATISAVFLYGQLREAQRSTNAAIENFRIDERAWVELEPYVKSPQGYFGKAKVFKYELRPKNVGKTVATDVSMSVTSIEGVYSEEDVSKAINSLSPLASTLIIKGHKVLDFYTTVPRVLAPNTAASVPSVAIVNTDECCLIGRIKYVDVFQAKHCMTFCYEVSRQDGELKACAYGNEEDTGCERTRE